MDTSVLVISNGASIVTCAACIGHSKKSLAPVRNAGVRERANGTLIKPQTKTVEGMQAFSISNPEVVKKFPRDFAKNPLNESDRFCYSRECLYIMFEVAKRKGTVPIETFERKKTKRKCEKQLFISDVGGKTYSRNSFDRYRTKATQLEKLFECISLKGMTVADICGGKHDLIYETLSKLKDTKCITNDLNPKVHSDYHLDVTDDLFIDKWSELSNRIAVQWIVTSPPYGANAIKCVKTALKLATYGIAMKLRLTFLEPCLERERFLKDHPISLLIPMRRDGIKGRDSVCEAWFIWYKNSDIIHHYKTGIYI